MKQFREKMLRQNSKFVLLLALLSAGSMWFYVQRIQIPYQKADAAAHGRPRGNFSDLYPRWLGARELLLRHRDPYSPEVTREIQAGYYGRALDPSRAEDPKDQQGFAYPLFVVFLLAPTVTLPFTFVQAAFLWFLVVLTFASVLLWLRALSWRHSTNTILILLLLVLSSYPAIQGIKLQQLSLLVSGLIAGAVVLLSGGYFALAGVLVGVATIKPQLTLPLTGWLLLWAVGDWRSRQRFVWGFLGTMIVLLGGAEILLPGWMGQFRHALAAYREYADAESLLDVLATPAGGHLLTLLIALATAIASWRLRHEPQGSALFTYFTAAVLAVTVVIMPKFAPYNQLLLLPAVFILLRDWDGQWRKTLVARFLSLIAVLVVAWPWLAAIGLTAASFFLPAEQVQRAWALPIRTSLVIPLVVLALLSLQGLHSRTTTR